MSMRSRLVAAAVLLAGITAIIFGALAQLHSLPLMIAAGVVALVVVALLTGVTARAWLRPVGELQAAVTRVVIDGDLGRRVAESRGHDELAELGRSYNVAMARVAEMYAALEVIVVTQRRFVADASHELRTPLTTVGSALEMLQRFTEMPPERRNQVVDDALHEARRMGSLVDDLLMLARLDSGERLDRVSFEWADVLAPAIAAARTSLGPRRLELELGEQLGRGVGDPAALRQLLSILFANVAVHTPGETVVTLAARRGSSDSVRLSVKDNGPGVPATRLVAITERFVQLDAARHGSSVGLGLSIAKAIAANHGGALQVAAVEPHGLTVSVTIPPMPVRLDRRRAPRPGRPGVSEARPSEPST